MPALGEEFRSAREARGLSLSDVAERLHIRSVYLAAIEEEDWTAIGAPVYVRGFMRTYARFLGIDAESAVGRFSAVVPSVAVTTRPVASARTERSRQRSAGPSIGAIAGIFVAIVLLGFVGYEAYQFRSEGGAPAPLARSSRAPSPAATIAGGISAAAASPEPSGAPPGSPSSHVVPAAKVGSGLAVRLTQKSWLRVTVDGRVAVEGIFPAGTAKSFTGKSADVRVGNAGGVRIALNGRELGPLGADGDVVERQFTLAGE